MIIGKRSLELTSDRLCREKLQLSTRLLDLLDNLSDRHVCDECGVVLYRLMLKDGQTVDYTQSGVPHRHGPIVIDLSKGA